MIYLPYIHEFWANIFFYQAAYMWHGCLQIEPIILHLRPCLNIFFYQAAYMWHGCLQIEPITPSLKVFGLLLPTGIFYSWVGMAIRKKKCLSSNGLLTQNAPYPKHFMAVLEKKYSNFRHFFFILKVFLTNQWEKNFTFLFTVLCNGFMHL